MELCQWQAHHLVVWRWRSKWPHEIKLFWSILPSYECWGDTYIFRWNQLEILKLFLISGIKVFRCGKATGIRVSTIDSLTAHLLAICSGIRCCSSVRRQSNSKRNLGLNTFASSVHRYVSSFCVSSKQMELHIKRCTWWHFIPTSRPILRISVFTKAIPSHSSLEVRLCSFGHIYPCDLFRKHVSNLFCHLLL